MKIAVVLASCITTLAFSATLSEAEPVPKRATGIWSIGKDCEGGSPAAMINSRAAIVVETRNDMHAVAIAEAEFIAGSHVLSFQGETEELILPPLEKLRGCKSLPGLLPIAFAEAIAVFPRLDEIAEACLEGSSIGALRRSWI
ncbi:MAG: hypothetical protein OXI87_24870 [Albidovulum sp.]|nr:hypothetical protein [Albidovulum sp.]